MALKFPMHPTTSSLLSSNTNINHTLIFLFFSSRMHLTTLSLPLQYPYSPPNSSLSSPLTCTQSSPQTDNDDYCAACKGPGEFLCCDGCPRSFHFLCCDPPRIDAPEGSFFCQECEARQKRVEDSTEIFSPLSPLFKRLEATNTRSFALPAEIRNYFDGVAAREDGSYSEVAKKFPL